jgi:TRAP-type C4-dicarboxylate transport system substrate-binding protein
MPRNSKPSGDTVSFGVRLSKTDREWLEKAAADAGVEVSQLVRWAIDALRQYIDAHEGTLHLPIDIKKFWTVAQEARPEQPAAAPAAEKRRGA